MGKKEPKVITAHSRRASIPDYYKTFEQLQASLRGVGIESMQLMLGIDFSKSNTWTGEKSYRRGLHDTSVVTPYEKAMRILDRVASKFDDDNVYPVYRFGCSETKDKTVVALLHPHQEDPHFGGIEAVVEAYKEATKFVMLSGPTTFAPIIEQAVAMSKAYENKQYIILVIFTDGDVSDVQRDAQAIIYASNYPISIAAVGLGDGPFKVMEQFDNKLKNRKFDNFQFLNFTKLEARIERAENPELILATALFQECPSQYKFMKQLGYL